MERTNKIRKNVEHIVNRMEYLESLLSNRADWYDHDDERWDTHENFRILISRCIDKIEDALEQFVEVV